MPAAEALTLVLLVGSAWSDIRTGKIPNRLTLPLLIIGILLSLVPDLGPPWWSSLLAAVATLVIGFFIRQAGLLGGGDVKMLAAIGALLGHEMLLESLLWTAAIGGVVSMILLGVKRALLPLLRRLVLAGWGWLRWGTSEPLVEGPGHPMPFGAVIAAGTAVALVAERLSFRWLYL